MANRERTGSRIARTAAQTLRDAGASKTAKTLAGSALAQSRTGKETSKATATTAAKALQGGRSGTTTRALAGSVLTQKPRK
jgi:hypothetical protein